MRRFVLLFLCCAGFFLLLFQLFRSFTDVGELRTAFPYVKYDPKEKTAEIQIVRKRPAGWVSLGEVSNIAYSAIVLSEDWAFWQHNGFDWDQVIDAFKTNLEKGKFARGGSTITQQVIKNVYLSNEKTLVRKAKEAILTMRIERHVSKKRILEIYLNIAELGPGIYGIGQASRYYFQKHPSQLTAKEGAFLAMLLPSPKKYSVSFRKKALTPYARSAVRSILAKLLATRRLSEEEYHAAMASPLSFEDVPMPLPESTPNVIEEETVEEDFAPF
jgi:monofunctional biosynthetic peptidoglycan transglycosylase